MRKRKYVYNIYVKSPSISGPTQFEPVFFKSPVYVPGSPLSFSVRSAECGVAKALAQTAWV